MRKYEITHQTVETLFCATESMEFIFVNITAYAEIQDYYLEMANGLSYKHNDYYHPSNRVKVDDRSSLELREILAKPQNDLTDAEREIIKQVEDVLEAVQEHVDEAIAEAQEEA